MSFNWGRYFDEEINRRERIIDMIGSMEDNNCQVCGHPAVRHHSRCGSCTVCNCAGFVARVGGSHA